MNSKLSNIIKDSPRVLTAPKDIVFNNVVNGSLSFFEMKSNRTGLIEFNLGGFFVILLSSFLKRRAKEKFQEKEKER